MNLFYKVQKVLLYIIFVLAVILLFNAMVEQYALIVIVVFTAIIVLTGYCITKFNPEHDVDAPLCKYCNNIARIKSYRERNGQTSSEIVCYRCHESTNEELTKIDKR